MLWIASDCQQSLCTGAEQQAVDLALVLQRQVHQLVGECEHDMDIAGGQEFPSARIEPAVAHVGLAFRTVPVAARNGDLPITCIMGSNF
jgi:hypothetical protein